MVVSDWSVELIVEVVTFKWAFDTFWLNLSFFLDAIKNAGAP